MHARTNHAAWQNFTLSLAWEEVSEIVDAVLYLRNRHVRNGAITSEQMEAMPDGTDSATGKPDSPLHELRLLPNVRTTHLKVRQRPSAPLAPFLPVPQSGCGSLVLTFGTTFVTLRPYRRTLSALNVPGGQKQFPMSLHGHRHLRVPRVLHSLEAGEQKARAAGRPDAPAIQGANPGGSAIGMRYGSFQNPLQ